MGKHFYPRDYQIRAVNATLDCLWNEPKESPLIVLPTGTGKAGVIAWVCKAVLMRLPGVRITVATHVKELVEQDAKTLFKVWPQAPVGICSAGLSLRQAAMPITVASIQTVAKNPDLLGKQHILIVDEAHLIPPGEESMYQKFIAALRKKNPNLIVIGLTATPFRQGQGMLTNGKIFTKICFDMSSRDDFVWFIDQGYLAPLVPKPTSFQYDVSKVAKVAGDFNQKQLQSTVDKDELTAKALHEAIQVAERRSHILVFGSGIAHVESIAAMLTVMGETVAYVHSKMPSKQRDKAIEDFKLGNVRWLINDGILTTGFDAPMLDCIVLLRPTMSVVLHIQILGRGTRPLYATHGIGHNGGPPIEFDLDTKEGRLAAIEASDKQNCLVLDFCGNVNRLGPINDPKIPREKGKGNGEIPVKQCPCCDTINHAAARFCEGENYDGTKCDHEFEFKTKIEQTAGTAALIAGRDPPEMHWFPVDSVNYEKYNRPHTEPMMKAWYSCGIRQFSEVVCLEHKSYAGKLAREWWRARLPQGVSIPADTAEGITMIDRLTAPTHIYVQTNTKYPKITAHSFNGMTPEWMPPGQKEVGDGKSS